MSAQHTPGPWAVGQNYGHLKVEVGAPNQAVATVWVRQNRNVPGEFKTEIGAWQRGEANARLIAAAPELLKASQDAEWALEWIVEDEELGDECPKFEGFDLCGAKCCEQSGCAVERLARVRAAIAKARGEVA